MAVVKLYKIFSNFPLQESIKLRKNSLVACDNGHVTRILK